MQVYNQRDSSGNAWTSFPHGGSCWKNCSACCKLPEVQHWPCRSTFTRQWCHHPPSVSFLHPSSQWSPAIVGQMWCWWPNKVLTYSYYGCKAWFNLLCVTCSASFDWKWLYQQSRNKVSCSQGKPRAIFGWVWPLYSRAKIVWEFVKAEAYLVQVPKKGAAVQTMNELLVSFVFPQQG